MGKNASAVKTDKESIIFHAALKTIKGKGFHRARMSDIAREAGISYGLVYHYFKNKEDLFDAIIDRWWDGLFYLMAEVKGDPVSVNEKLRRIIRYFLDVYRNQPELVHVFVTEISRSAANLTHPRLERIKKFMALTEDVMKEGQKSGDLRDDFKPRYLTYIFLGGLESFVSTMVLAEQSIRGDAQKRRIEESLLEVFLNGATTQTKAMQPSR